MDGAEIERVSREAVQAFSLLAQDRKYGLPASFTFMFQSNESNHLKGRGSVCSSETISVKYSVVWVRL